MSANTSKTASRILLAAGSVMCLWVGAALVSALSSTGWSVSALAGQYMSAIGMVKPLHTLVDYYTHIKGIEYILCVAFFVAFPIFFKYVNKTPAEAKKAVKK
jgi:Na+-driven multidrug efflux pump